MKLVKDLSLAGLTNLSHQNHLRADLVEVKHQVEIHLYLASTLQK